MDLLYKAVMKGSFPAIPGIYSNDLAALIKSMIQVNPESRPDCGQLLALPVIARKMQWLELGREREKVDLLKTIRWPGSGGKKPLQQHKSEVISLNLQLPGSNYGKKASPNQVSNRVKSQDMQDAMLKMGSPKKFYLEQKKGKNPFLDKSSQSRNHSHLSGQIELSMAEQEDELGRLAPKRRRIPQTLEARKMRVSNSQHEKIEEEDPETPVRPPGNYYLKDILSVNKGQQNKLPQLHPSISQHQVEEEYQLLNDEDSMKKRGVSNKIPQLKYQMRKPTEVPIALGPTYRDRSMVSLDKDSISIDRLSNDILPKLRQRNRDCSNLVTKRKYL